MSGPNSRDPSALRASKFDVDVVTDWACLASEDEAFGKVVGFENVAVGHLNLTGNHRSHTRAAMSLAAGMRHVDSSAEHQVHQRLIAGPGQAVGRAVQLDDDFGVGGGVDGFDFCHAAIVAGAHRQSELPAR